MAETARSWAPRSAWAGIAQAGQIGTAGPAGVTATLLDGFGLATLIAAPGGTPALSQAIDALLGITLPTTPKIASGAAHDAIWSGPDQWLLRAATRDGFSGLLEALSAQAAVSGYAAHGLFLGQALVDVLLHMFFEGEFVKGGAGFVPEFGGIGAGDDQNVFPAGIVLLVIAHGGLQGQGNGFLKALGKFAAESDPAVSAQCCF